jgi:hypothetical protein
MRKNRLQQLILLVFVQLSHVGFRGIEHYLVDKGVFHSICISTMN